MKRLLALAFAVAVAPLAIQPAAANFVTDPSCTTSGCNGDVHMLIDIANKDVTTFGATVGGNPITVNTNGPVDTGSGFANITPFTGTMLFSLQFVPADSTLFSSFSFRGQMAAASPTPTTIAVSWSGSLGDSGTIDFTVPKNNMDFGSLGIVTDPAFLPAKDTLVSVTAAVVAPSSFKEFKQVQFNFGMPTSVPEPASIALLGVGLVGLGLARRRRPTTK